MRIRTSDVKPFETKYDPTNTSYDPRGVLIAKTYDKTSKDKKLVYEVVDPTHGLQYIMPVNMPVSDIIANHCTNVLKDGASVWECRKSATVVAFQSAPRKYFYSVVAYKRCLVFRMWLYQTKRIPTVQGYYEAARLIFHKKDIYVEYPDGTLSDFSFASAFRHTGLFGIKTQCIELNSDEKISPKDIDVFNFKKMFNYHDDIHNFSAASNMCLAFYISNYQKTHRKAHINENVPLVVKDALFSDAEHLNGYVIVNGGREDTEDPWWNNGPVKAYIGDDRVYYFKKNPMTGEWYSANRKSCAFLINHVTVSDMFRKNAKNKKRKYIDELKKTIFKNCIYNLEIDGMASKSSLGMLQILYAQQKYLSVEQALKMSRYDLALSAMEYIEDKERRQCVKVPSLDINQKFQRIYAQKNIEHFDAFSISLPKLWGVSGKQLKFIYHYSEADVEGRVHAIRCRVDNFRYHLNDEQYIELFPDIKTRCLFSSISIDRSRLDRITEHYAAHGKAPQGFFRALSKNTLPQIQNKIIEYSDYIRSLDDLREYEVRNGLELNFPLFLKPSSINHWHDQMIKVQTQKNHEKENESIVQQKIDLAEMEYNNKDYSIILPSTAGDIELEGIKLSHCVGNYIYLVANRDTTILFLRKNKDIDKPFLTLEVGDDDEYGEVASDNKKAIKQCFGYHDTFNTDESVANFIREYAEAKGYLIKCPIYRPKGK